MSLQITGVRPLRGDLCNVRTGEIMPFLFNPTEFEETVQVNYNRLSVVGMSHQTLQYAGTSNTVIPFEFYLDKFFAQQIEPGADPDILNFKRFLQAGTVPSAGSEDIISGAPARMLIVWPGLISLSCVLTGLAFQYRQFGVLLDVLVYTARATFEEVRDVRMTSDEIRQVGSQRGGAF